MHRFNLRGRGEQNKSEEKNNPGILPRGIPDQNPSRARAAAATGPGLNLLGVGYANVLVCIRFR